MKASFQQKGVGLFRCALIQKIKRSEFNWKRIIKRSFQNRPKYCQTFNQYLLDDGKATGTVQSYVNIGFCQFEAKRSVSLSLSQSLSKAVRGHPAVLINVGGFGVCG
jgi:hypothetical protein